MTVRIVLFSVPVEKHSRKIEDNPMPVDITPSGPMCYDETYEFFKTVQEELHDVLEHGSSKERKGS